MNVASLRQELDNLLPDDDREVVIRGGDGQYYPITFLTLDCKMNMRDPPRGVAMLLLSVSQEPIEVSAGRRGGTRSEHLA